MFPLNHHGFLCLPGSWPANPHPKPCLATCKSSDSLGYFMGDRMGIPWRYHGDIMGILWGYNGIYIYIFHIRPFVTVVAARATWIRKHSHSAREISAQHICKLRYSHVFTGQEEIVSNCHGLVKRGSRNGFRKLRRQSTIECWRILLQGACGPLASVCLANRSAFGHGASHLVLHNGPADAW